MKKPSLIILSIILVFTIPMNVLAFGNMFVGRMENVESGAVKLKSFPKAIDLKRRNQKKFIIKAGSKKTLWYKSTAIKEYVRVFLDGRKMKGSVNVEIYSGKKRILKKTVDFGKTKQAWVESNKRISGDYYIKIMTKGKKTSGTLKVKNVTVVTKEKLNKDMLRLVNEARKKEGLPPCFWDESLEKAALIRAKDMGAKFSHDRPDGTNLSTAYGEGLSENLATESDTVRAFNMWMNSPGHKATILTDWKDEYAKKVTYGFVCASSSYGSVMAIKEYVEY